MLNQFSSECKGTTRQIIGRNVFNNVRVVLHPSGTTTNRIHLDTKTSLIDSLIEKTQKGGYSKRKEPLINEVVTKGLNHNVKMKDSGEEWIGEIPDGWKIVPLRYLGSFQNGISKGSEFFGTGYPFMSMEMYIKTILLQPN